MFKNSELSFVVVDEFDHGLGAWIVSIEFFKKNKYIADNHIKANIDNWEQTMESFFQPNDKSFTLEEAHNNLISQGLIYNEEMAKFLHSLHANCYVPK